jgi:two-component system, NtrC family, response regulator AtoC
MIELVAQSEAMQEAVGLADRVAATDANVLITGESGAGKDALAFYIHARSPRALQPLVKIDCATLPGELLEAELFGYERGAFTSASETKPGRLEAAHGGTLVLDEIAYLSNDSQAKLLRVIETREFERLGGRETIKVDARLLALTNVDLTKAVARRNFREDLFYRLNVVHIHVPPLRERVADLPKLTRSLVRTYAAKHGREVDAVSPEVVSLLSDYDFPGNVRELANAIERAVIFVSGKQIEVADLPSAMRASVSAQRQQRQPRSLAEVEADYLQETLSTTGGNKTAAARILGISRKNLYERLERLAKGSEKVNHGSNGDEVPFDSV